MKKYLAVPKTVQCSMPICGIIFPLIKASPDWCWHFGPGEHSLPAAKFPTWLCQRSDGTHMAGQDGDMYRADSGESIWFTENPSSACRFHGMVCSEPSHLLMARQPAVRQPVRMSLILLHPVMESV